MNPHLVTVSVKPSTPWIWMVAGLLGGLALGMLLSAGAVDGLKRDWIKAGVICVEASCYRISPDKIGG